MFELCEVFLMQLVQLIPSMIALWLLFDLTGSLFTGRGV